MKLHVLPLCFEERRGSLDTLLTEEKVFLPKPLKVSNKTKKSQDLSLVAFSKKKKERC